MDYLYMPPYRKYLEALGAFRSGMFHSGHSNLVCTFDILCAPRRPRRLVYMARSFSRLSSSAQLLFTGVALECVNLLLCVLAVIPFADANIATALLLLLLIVGGLASSVALVCALVGLVKFRQYRMANICLAVISVVANPLMLLVLYMAAY